MGLGTINDLIVIRFTHEDYRGSDQLDHSSDANIRYYGFLNRAGAWYIMERDNTTGITYRFIKGGSGYAVAWAAKETLSYDLYDATFG